MKRTGMVLLLLTLAASASHAEEKRVLANDKEMLSYSIGVDIARNFRKDDVQFDPELLMKGMNDVIAGEKLLMPEKEVRRVLNGFRSDLRRKMAVDRKMAADVNKKRGDEFLAANRTKEGVVTLPSGVQYRVIRAGNGKRPTDLDTIECHYRGTLLNGAEFDATADGKPAMLEVARLIPGWREALRQMPEGSQWQIAIPPQLAYGERGVGTEIGPNETLLFDVELLAVK